MAVNQNSVLNIQRIYKQKSLLLEFVFYCIYIHMNLLEYLFNVRFLWLALAI